MAPPTLACRLQSLPPILDNLPRTPTSSCSKGSRGLSVQPRVLGIFTETTVSPDPSKRQRPSRYAIRAGRNFAFTLHFWRRRLSLHLGVLRRVRSLRADLHSVCGTRDSVTKGRRLITSIDLPPIAAENAMSRPEGRSVVTGSTSAVRVRTAVATSHGITLSLSRRP